MKHFLSQFGSFSSTVQTFITLNLNKEAPQWFHGTGSREEGEGTSQDDDVGKEMQKREYSLSMAINIEQLTENGDIGWSTLYDRFIEEINKDPSDLLGPAIDNEEEIAEEDELMEEENDNDQDEYRFD
ncbi:hypothetical protein RhiirC2_790962 [Rhizophagus irregularis]|uniref:Uncharacterized protein n=1 Tax=Rhizophagus irregularis TaxID=588596 RepID=A0A2N1MKA8_9GLOM|nr:hypothetical protein RhiirC2_790962 [Rhizophagus irregularis]